MFGAFEAADVPGAAALFCDVFWHEPWRYDWLVEENVRRYFEDMCNTPGFMGFKAVIGGRPAGFCAGVYQDYFTAPNYEIKEIVIARNMQRSGLGGRLLEYAERKVAARGSAAVTLMTKKDIGAYPFYLKNGYSVLEASVHMGKAIKR